MCPNKSSDSTSCNSLALISSRQAVARVIQVRRAPLHLITVDLSIQTAISDFLNLSIYSFNFNFIYLFILENKLFSVQKNIIFVYFKNKIELIFLFLKIQM